MLESILTLTNMGYMKRMTVDTYKAQNRGGRGIMGMSRREEDVAKTMFSCSSHDVVFLFTNTGKVFRKKAYEIPASSRTGKGVNVEIGRTCCRLKRAKRFPQWLKFRRMKTADIFAW